MELRKDIRQTESRVVQIQEVDMTNYRIIARDYHNQNIMISLQFHDPLTAIPSIGETWLVQRKGTDWFLEKRQDNKTETNQLTTLRPGDYRIETKGRLLLQGADIFLNGASITTGQPAIDIPIQNAGIDSGAGKIINFIAGDNIILDIEENPDNNSIDITITSPSKAGLMMAINP